MADLKSLKILFLCSWYPNRTNKTLGNFIQKHAEAISQFHEVTVLCLISDQNTKQIECVINDNNGLREILVYYPKIKYKIPIFGSFIKAIRQYNAFKTGWKKISEKGKQEITHLNVTYSAGIWAVFIKKIKRIPFVITEHSSGFHSKENGYSKFILKLCKIILKNASFIMPVSEDLKSHLIKIHPKGKYKSISNVVDKSIFKINDEKQKENNFIHVSTAYEAAKNLLGIIRVIKELSEIRKDFKLHIVSDGDIKKAHELSRELGVLNSYVIFHETKTTLEISKMYQGKKALILFSNFENFPCVIPEAWMSGVPVIATNVNGIPEYLNKQNGILVEPKNEKMLLEAMNKILDNQATFDKNKMREFAIKHFSYNAVAKKYSEIYSKVIPS